MKAILCALSCAAILSATTLVKDGHSKYSICVSSQAIPSEQRAASELQTFLAEMSGARLQVTADCKASRGPYIRLGTAGAPAQSFGPEEYVVKTSGRDLIIAGGRPRGTLYGVYGFLDRLGCRWFTSDVSRIPKQPTVNVPELNVREKPAFEYREPYVTEALEKNWAVRNRVNGHFEQLDVSTGGKVEYFPFVHSFYSLIPPEKYFKDHPEYFSLIDGQRRIGRGQLCLTNPEVLRLGVEQVRQWIREHPTVQILSVSQNDWEGWCECDRCRRVEEEEGGQHSGPILRYVNAVAAEIEKTNPDKLIDTLAYWYTENPPAKVRPRPNVRIRLCPIGVCEAHPYERCPRSAYFVSNLKAWSRITNQLYIWHYNTNFSHYLAPFPDFDELAANIPLYQRSGVVGIFLEGAYPRGGGAENSELRSYVMARLLWNPQTDVNRDIDEFLEAVYGRAAKPMRQYIDLLQHEVRMAPEGLGQHIWIFNVPAFSPSFLPESNRLMREALDAESDPAIKRRIQKAALPVEYVELTEAREYHLADTSYAPADLAGWQVRFREFVAKLRGFGITSIHEGRDLEQDERTAAAMKPYRVIRLENEYWKVAIAPELNGRILEMTDKRHNRNLLRRSTPGEGNYPNLGGQLVEAFPDFPLRAWEASWRAVSSGASDAVLAATCANGVRLQRKVWLEGEWLRTEATAENSSAAPIEVVLEARADFEPGDIDAARLKFRTAGGEAVDRSVISPGEIPNGTETRMATNVPDGEWAVILAGRPVAMNRFPKELVERATASWTAKGGPRVTLGVWSQKRMLAPGGTVRLATDYR